MSKYSKFQRRTNYLLLPVMLLYTFLPGFSVYAAEVHTVGGTSANRVVEKSPTNENSFNNTIKQVKQVNSLNKLNSSSRSSSSKLSPSSSMASNYTMGVGAKVNPQTGQLDLNFNNIKFKGANPDISVNLGISNGGGNRSILGLPLGWKFNIDYIDIDTQSRQPKKLYISGKNSYTIDFNFSSYGSRSGDKYNSGLRYYTSKNICFRDKKKNLPLPYSNNLTYRYILSSETALSNEYFDYKGKLICSDDRFGNYIIYHYDDEDHPGNKKTVYGTRLSSISESSYGQKININYESSGYKITVTMPDGRTAVYDFTSPGIISIKGLLKRITHLYLQNNKINTIVYPTGGTVVYTYTNDAIPYYANGSKNYFRGITKVVQKPSSDPDSYITTLYNYKSNNDHAFTGFSQGSPLVYSPDKDALMQSGNNSYKYTITVTSKRTLYNGGDVTTPQTFNFLHLPLSTTTKANGKTIKQSFITYLGANSGNFPHYNKLKANYNLPAEVTSYTPKKSSTEGNEITREHKVKTKFDDFSRPVSVTEFNKGDMIAKKTMEYFPGNSLLKSKTVYDLTKGGTTTVVENSLSSNKKYINSSHSYIVGSNDADDSILKNITLDEKGRITRSKISRPNKDNDEDPSTIVTSYIRTGDKLKTTTTNSVGDSTSNVIDIHNGRVLSETDGTGNSVTHEFSNSGLIVKNIYPDTSSHTFDYSDPNKTVVSYSNGKVLTSYLDGFGRVYKKTDNLGPGRTTRTLTTTKYNELGKVAEKTDLYGHITTYKYDYHGLILKKDYLKNTEEEIYDDVAQTVLKKRNGVEVSLSHFDDKGKVTSTTSYLSKNNTKHTATYNGKGQKTSSVLSLPETNDQDLATSTMTYDVSGKLKTRTVNITDSDKDRATGITVYKRSLLGGITSRTTKFDTLPESVKGPKIIVSERKIYNSAGQLITLINQQGKKIHYTYNHNAKLVTMKNFTGNTFSRTYDNMGRQIIMKGPGVLVKNTYYSVGTNAYAGMPKTKELYLNGDLTDTISYSYNDIGLISRVNQNGKSLSFTYENNPANRIESMTDFAGKTTRYTYENEIKDNIKTVSKHIGSSVYSATFEYYNKHDNALFGAGKTVKQITYSNGITVNNVYTFITGKAPKLNSVITRNSQGELINGSYYTYDIKWERVNSILQKSQMSSDMNCNNIKEFTYNCLGQLTDEIVYRIAESDRRGKKIYSTKYIYDSRKNITDKTIRDDQDKIRSINKYQYNNINHLTEIEETKKGTTTHKNLKYDPNGNLTDIQINHRTIKRFTYNTLDQLTEYNDLINDVHAIYQYNAESHRKSKYYAGESDNRIEYYYLPGSSTIINEGQGDNPNDEIMSSYLIAGGNRVLRVVGNNKKIQWFIKNGKDVIGTTDNSGQKSEKIYQYNAYGEDINLMEGGKVSPGKKSFDINDNPYKYSGYYLDEESGLYYLKARLYAPNLMRFITRDTKDLMNRYAYANGDPIMKTDPSGHDATLQKIFTPGNILSVLGMVMGIAGVIVSAIVAPESTMISVSLVLGIVADVTGGAGLGTGIAAEFEEGKTQQILRNVSIGLGIGSMVIGLVAGVIGGIREGVATMRMRRPRQMRMRVQAAEEVHPVRAAAPNEETQLIQETSVQAKSPHRKRELQDKRQIEEGKMLQNIHIWLDTA